MSSWLRVATRAVESILVDSGIAARLAVSRKRTRAVLAFHNICQPDAVHAGDTSLHMRVDAFAELISQLKRRVAIVSLAELLRPSTPTRGMRVAITFDDAYVGAIEHGLSVLRSLSCPSTVFVAPGLLGQSSTWWDEAAQQHHGAMPSAQRDEWLDGPAGGSGDAIRAGRAEWTYPSLPPDHAIADATRMVSAARTPGVTLASHTWSHINVAAVASAAANDHARREQLEAELRRPLEWLRAQPGDTLNMLAYPYGRWNARAEEAARAAGYDAAFRVDGGALIDAPAADAPFALPRINVPSLMRANGVLMRLSGLRA